MIGLHFDFETVIVICHRILAVWSLIPKGESYGPPIALNNYNQHVN
jgi:hypothetical protein